MKSLSLLLLLAAMVLLLPSCKKEDLDPDKTNGRTGLERLVDAEAENYAVFIMQNDTVVFQDTRDSLKIHSGKRQGFPYLSDFVGAEMIYKSPQSTFSKMTFVFNKTSKYLYVVEECTMPDTLIHLGKQRIWKSADKEYISMVLIPKGSTETNTVERNDTASSNIEVLSKVDTEMPSGCKTVKVKIKFTNVKFWDSICGPEGTYIINEGIMVLNLRHTW